MTNSLNGQTIYVILASVDGGSVWTVEGRQPATGKASALSHFYEERPLPTGNWGEAKEGSVGAVRQEPMFQAIPSSSWKLLRPTPTRLRTPFAEVA